MKHARTDALDRLEPLLEQLRAVDGLTEKSRGVFYRKSKAFLHFHEDPTGDYADVRFDGVVFERVRATTASEQRVLLRRVTAALSGAAR